MRQARLVILADADWMTCTRCRACVPMGRTCLCPARTKGPSVEPVLTRIVTKRQRLTTRRTLG